MACDFICVKPVWGVIPMPENNNRCMPVQGAKVPNQPYYRKLIKSGDLVKIDCTTMQVPVTTQFTGVMQGSDSNEFNGAQVLNIGSLLATSGWGNAGVYEIDIDVRETHEGVSLVRGGGSDIIQSGGSRSWHGSDDGLGNLTNATDFVLTLKQHDVVVINWAEIS